MTYLMLTRPSVVHIYGACVAARAPRADENTCPGWAGDFALTLVNDLLAEPGLTPGLRQGSAAGVHGGGS